MSIKIYSMKLIFVIFLFSFLSCKTVKYIDRIKTVTDSTVIEQNEGLQKVLAETVQRYESEREQWESTGILFDTIYTSDTIVVNKVTFDNGRLKSAEGRIRAVNIDLYEKSAELLNAHSTIDSLSVEIERRDLQLSKKQETVVKNVTRKVYIWWPMAIALITGIFIEFKFKIMKRLLYFLPVMLLFILQGCVDFKDSPGKSVWSEGMWIIPCLTGLGSIWFLYLAYRASKSNSTRQDKEKGIIDNTGNVPIYKLGKFYFGCALALATLIIIIIQTGAR